MRAPRRYGFTILELMIAALILAMMTFASWELLRGGLLQTSTTSDHLSAIQSAMLLMESIQEDCRQIVIRNEGGGTDLTSTAPGGGTIVAPLLHYSLEFSKNQKSVMFRKSSRADFGGSESSGSAFTVVVYQLVKRADKQDAFSIRRLEKSADGRVVATGRAADDKAFRNLILKDIRWDFVTRLDGMATYRTFLRCSLTVVNDAPDAGKNPADSKNPKFFFISNVFEVESPEPLHSTERFPGGFARPFVQSNKWRLAPNTPPITAGKGYSGYLPPPNFGDRQKDWTRWDYLDSDGKAKDFASGATGAPPGTNPFTDTNVAAPQIRKEFVESSTKFIAAILSEDFRGRVEGRIAGRAARGSPPPWTQKFALDCSDNAKESVAVQINKILDLIIPRGPEAVAEMGHAFRAIVPTAIAQKPPPPNLLGSIAALLITTEQAALIVQGK
jgi:Tfp pilus assembly protein FimT